MDEGLLNYGHAEKDLGFSGLFASKLFAMKFSLAHFLQINLVNDFVSIYIYVCNLLEVVFLVHLGFIEITPECIAKISRDY